MSRTMLKYAWGFVAAIALVGCADKSDETEALQQLQPKPMSEEQKQMIEKVKQSAPNAPRDHAGAVR